MRRVSWVILTVALLQDAPRTAAPEAVLLEGGTLTAKASPQGVVFDGWRIEPSVPAVFSTSPRGVTYQYEGGNVVEWYHALEFGIEQGFTVNERPVGDLVLMNRVFGAVEVSREKRGLRLGHISVGQLRAADAAGTTLAASLDWAAPGETCRAPGPDPDGFKGCLVVRLSEATLSKARFPIVIDPLFSAAAWVVSPAGEADARFGGAIDSAGDVNGDGYGDVILGAYQWSGQAAREGRAFLYLGSPTGLSSTPDWVADPTDQANANFGYSVAGAGDLNADGYGDVVIGADQWDGPLGTDEGRAYVYYGSPTGLRMTPDLTIGSQQAQSNFGQPVAAAGDVNGDGYADVIIGARYYNGAAINEGRAQVFLGGPGGLDPAAAWTLDPTDQVAASFGSSANAAGDVNGDGFGDVVVGVYGFDDEFVDEGRAYLYLGSDAGLSTTAAWFDDPVDQTTGRFSISVGSAGDVNGDGFGDLVMGAWAYDSDAGLNEGRAWLYLGNSAGVPTLSQTFDPADQTGAAFGYATAGAGDLNGDGYSDMLAGAFGQSEVAVGEGRAYLYVGFDQGLRPTAEWTADPTDQLFAQFSNSVSRAGDVNGDGIGDALISAHLWDNLDAGRPNEGRAFAYLGATAGPSTAPSQSLSGAEAQFGAAVASAGDVNGDGFVDAVVGAPGFGGGAGQASLWWGGPTGLTPSPWTAAPTTQADAGFGAVVASAGDTNGDGFADVLVAAPASSTSLPAEGRVYLFLGSASGLQATAAWSQGQIGQAAAAFGSSLGAGDFDGDGFSDVAVGAPGAGVDARGNVSVYRGGRTGLSATPSLVVAGSGTDERLGTALASCDLNGDGFADLAVGRSDGLGPGSVVVYPGGASGLDLASARVLQPTTQPGAAVGRALATGDVNADGRCDLVIGAPLYDDGATDTGAVWVSLGTSTSGPLAAPQTLAQFGASVAAGDFDGDGFAEVVGARPRFDLAQVDEGNVVLFRGATAGPQTTFSWSTESTNQASGFVGTSLASDDFNGDGYADLLVGAPGLRRVLVSLGGDGHPGLGRRQRQSFGAATTARGAGALGPITLAMRATQEGTFGGRLRVDFEVRPVGVPFDGTVTAASSPVVGGEVGAVTLATLGLGAYHWRSRVVYPVGSGFSRWVSYGANSESEADFRIVPVPIDAGTSDAGRVELDGGSVELDGGRVELDGGVREERRPSTYLVGCGCASSEGSAVILLVALARSLRRRAARLTESIASTHDGQTRRGSRTGL